MMNQKPEIANYTKQINKLVELIDSIDEITNEEEANLVRVSVTSQVQRAIDSYNGDFSDFRECWKCGLPLVKGSMAYDEGFHFDSCI